MALTTLKTGAISFALVLLGFGVASAMPAPAIKGSDRPIVLAEDQENPEVQNLIDPATDNGAPNGDAATTDQPPAEAAPAPAQAAPSDTNGSTEMQQESK